MLFLCKSALPKPSQPVSPEEINLSHELQTEPSLLKWGVVLQFILNLDAVSSAWRCDQMGNDPDSIERRPGGFNASHLVGNFVKQLL